ncbi:hypothetical protein R1sor_017469 [Riccia sorocarpa]|uniref:Uncharacterized protein n=1 Tax=Riccia sorocarpa TaxID=122646 RepID=A0ABD3IAY5_9MARC
MASRCRRSSEARSEGTASSELRFCDHDFDRTVKIALFAAVLGLLISAGRAEHYQCLASDLHYSPTLTPFIDELPIPDSIKIMNGSQLVLGAYKITQVLHSNLSATTLYAYGTSEATAT